MNISPRTRLGGYGVVLLCILCFLVLLWVVTIGVRLLAVDF